MKITELLTESRKIDEAPMGMLNKFGNKVLSKFGNDKSTGKLKSGDVANKLYSAFNQYLGQSGQQPTWPVVSNWLKANKYPIKQAEKIVKGARAADKIPKSGIINRVQQLGKSALDKAGELGDKFKNKGSGSADLSNGNVVSEAAGAPLDKKTLEKVFMAAAQEAAVIVQQQKQNKMNGGGQQQNRQGNGGGLSVQQGGKDPQITQKVDDLEQRVSNLEQQAGATRPKTTRRRN